jgi:hypothetical protein
MGDLPEPEETWDEYAWEKFLQEQDRKTEKYMELLERYIDHPNRDQVIAREMGWYHLLDRDGLLWAEDMDSLYSHQAELGEIEQGAEAREGFECHPLYRAAFALTVWVEQWLEGAGEKKALPCAVRLSNQVAVMSAKLAAALSEDDVDEIGMTIAYLKRALRAANQALEAGMQFKLEAGFGGELRSESDGGPDLERRLFQVRDGIVELMGVYRAEWRRRNSKG